MSAIDTAKRLIEKYAGEWISKRDGFVMIKITNNNKEIIVWIRQTPITHKAMILAEKIVSKYHSDEKILLKLYEYADYVPKKELQKKFRIITKQQTKII
ncbi:MAG: hypothetical protein Q6363_007910 [Candidatus Njordarchaeota archaeon]